MMLRRQIGAATLEGCLVTSYLVNMSVYGDFCYQVSMDLHCH